MEARALRIHPADDVAVLLSPALAAGTRITVGGVGFTTLGSVATGHKIALRAIGRGEPILKYGQPFGRATHPIGPGEWVHSHNVESMLGANESYAWNPGLRAPTNFVPAGEKTFQGYRRSDGRVGVRNEIWVLCTVGCINRAAEEIARRANEIYSGRNGSAIDGVYAFTHPYGCSQLGHDLQQTRSIISALAAHPNCGGVLLIGLGCENNILQEQVAELRCADSARVRYFSAQESDDELGQAVGLIGELAAVCEADKRETFAASRLVIGMKCGGSDGFSGLTANPLVGTIADRVAASGGTAILTEVPEMFGAERLLMRRAANRLEFDRIERMITSFKDYFRRYNEPINENPSPGNKAGGITTLEEKSLGCIQKGGATASVQYVLDYGESVPPPSEAGGVGGLALAYGPGNDAVSCTTLAAAGAQMVLFTTGRGTPFGTCVPTLKISTNSDLARRKPHWIDFDAGPLVETGVALKVLSDALLDQILEVASGERLTKNEENGYREIAVFKDGVTL